MNNHKITFPKDVDGMKLLASFLAKIVKEGIEYNITNDSNNITVELTGGF